MCGMTSAADVALAVEAGADAVGFIFAPSRRRVDLATAVEAAQAVPAFVHAVGVFVDPTLEELRAAARAIPGLVVQLSGDESSAFCARVADEPGLRGRPYIKVLHVEPNAPLPPSDPYVGALPLFDTADPERRGGTGRPFAWSILEKARPPRFAVSGGLRPENVGACVRAVRPYAVDVRSGVESGERKDFAKMRAFVRAVREADAET
jgi:phosphoribosylanthranilate isomerase